MTNEKYNGWTNRETWATHLWLTSDEDYYQEYRNQTADDIRRGLTMLFASNGPIDGNTLSMITDIGSLWRVNWDEIANALKTDK